jgi:hypothetical protein
MPMRVPLIGTFSGYLRLAGDQQIGTLVSILPNTWPARFVLAFFLLAIH